LPRATVYVIKGGDNLTRIASQYSTSIEAIQAANPGLQANTIFAGNRIIVPVSRPDFRGKGAIIGNNETLQTIADRFKVNVDDLARFNGYASPADAKPGDAVLIQ
jgi:LysM repeat protein